MVSRKKNSVPVNGETKRASLELTTWAKAHAGNPGLLEKLDTSSVGEVQSWTAARQWAEAIKGSIIGQP
jgi:hypothetical protein